MSNQQSSQQSNPFASPYAQATPQDGPSSIPYYLTEQVPNTGFTATVNQPQQTTQSQQTPIDFNTSATQPSSRPATQKEKPFTPNATCRYAILRNPYTTLFTVTDKGALQLSKLSFDITRVGLDESISHYNWLQIGRAHV